VNTLDIILFAIIGLGAFFGHRRGLVLTLYRLVGFILAFFLARRFQPVVADFLRGTFVYYGIRNRVAEGTAPPDASNLFRVTAIEDHVTGFFTNVVINILSLLIVFFLVLIILYFAGKALGIVDMIPVVRTFNRLGGLIVGGLLGFGIVWIVVFVLTIFYSAGTNETLIELVQGSELVAWLLGRGWMVILNGH